MYEVLSTRIEADIGTVRAVDVDTLDTYDLLLVGAPFIVSCTILDTRVKYSQGTALGGLCEV